MSKKAKCPECRTGLWLQSGLSRFDMLVFATFGIPAFGTPVATTAAVATTTLVFFDQMAFYYV